MKNVIAAISLILFSILYTKAIGYSNGITLFAVGMAFITGISMLIGQFLFWGYTKFYKKIT